MPTTGFHDIVLPEVIMSEFSGGDEFRTEIHEAGAGVEFRDAKWSEARGRWSLQTTNLTGAEKDIIIKFYRGRLGRGFSFRHKNWTEFTALADLIGTADGDSEMFELFHQVTDGLVSSFYRVVLPVAPADIDVTPFKLYEDAVEKVGGFTVDYRNGRVTYDSVTTKVGTDIFADEIASAYWIDSDGGTDLTVFNVSDKLIITGFATSGNNTVFGTPAVVQEVDNPGNRFRIDQVLVDESAGPTVTVRTMDGPALDVVLTWDGEFDNPVRFENDHLSARRIDFDVYHIDDISVIGVLPEEIIEPYVQ